MVRAMRRSLPCSVCLLAACFSEPIGGGGGADETGAGTGTSAAATTNAPETGVGTHVTSTTTSHGEVTGHVDDTGVTSSSSDTGTVSLDLSTAICASTGFDQDDVGCSIGALLLPIGTGVVAFTNPANVGELACVGDVDDGTGATAPLDDHYVALHLDASEPARMSFEMPLVHVAFSFGPEHAEMASAQTSICVSTDPTCTGITEDADDTAAGMIALDLGGADTVQILAISGAARIGIDGLEICWVP